MPGLALTRVYDRWRPLSSCPTRSDPRGDERLTSGPTFGLASANTMPNGLPSLPPDVKASWRTWRASKQECRPDRGIRWSNEASARPQEHPARVGRFNNGTALSPDGDGDVVLPRRGHQAANASRVGVDPLLLHGLARDRVEPGDPPGAGGQVQATRPSPAAGFRSTGPFVPNAKSTCGIGSHEPRAFQRVAVEVLAAQAAWCTVGAAPGAGGIGTLALAAVGPQVASTRASSLPGRRCRSTRGSGDTLGPPRGGPWPCPPSRRGRSSPRSPCGRRASTALHRSTTCGAGTHR